MRVGTVEERVSLRVVADPGQSVPGIGSLVLPVFGGGHIEFGQGMWSHGGVECGLSVGVSWGEYGYAGGSLDRAAVAELRDHLTACLDGTVDVIRDPEQDEVVARALDKIRAGRSAALSAPAEGEVGDGK